MPDPFSVSTTLAVPVWAVIALALALFVLLIWAALPLLSKPVASRWPFANPDANALLVAMVILGTLLFLGAVGAAFTVLVHTFRVTETGGAGPNLGAGALIAALLGAPFLIWGTVLKHQTVRYQKEGHMTDRIAKAVEMLGAEKTVTYIARNVTRPSRPSEEREAGENDWVDQFQKLDKFSLTHDRVLGEEFDYREWQAFSETVPNLEVRIGAILSLERIAQDSTTHDKGRDHVRVMEILCAYIRENAPASSAQDNPHGEWEPLKNDPTEDECKEHLTKRKERFDPDDNSSVVREWAQDLPTPREDIALALKIIGRRTHDQLLVEAAWPAAPSQNTTRPVDTPCPALPDDPGEAALSHDALGVFKRELETWTGAVAQYSGYRLDLRHANLQKADLQEGNFDWARFINARMEGADLSETRMKGADLSWARMEGADLREARMEGAVLREARMEGAVLSRARMEGVVLRGARMEGAVLRGARMEGAYLREARMEGANLRAARMEGANLITARMEGADLSETRMEGANLSGTRMDSSTSLSAAAFQGAALREVAYSLVTISVEQVNASFGDASVTLPEALQPHPCHWLQWKPRYWSGDESEVTFYSEWLRWQKNPDTYIPPPPPDAPSTPV